MSNFSCQECGSPSVTHVLVNYRHVVYEPPQYFCRTHAFGEGRADCHICESYPDMTVVMTEDDETLHLKRTYPVDELDDEDMCSDHP